MPLPIAHGLVGTSLIGLIHPSASLKNWKPLFIGFVLANSPDLDFFGSFIFGLKDFHRGFTHSILFAFVISALLFLLLRKQNWRVPLAYSIAFLSHTILDFLFAQSGGVRLFIPFDYGSYRLGIISFSELQNGFNKSDLIKFSVIETLVFTPIFLLMTFYKNHQTR